MRFLLLFLAFLLCHIVSAEEKSIRTYYIAAEDVLWDYAPSYPVNPMMNMPFSEGARVFVEGNGKDRIGRKYWKAQYVEYTDASFSVRRTRPAEWEHLGLLGPVIRAVVGDTIKIVFKNNTKEQFVSMHAHGVFYDKASEGTPYDDGSTAAEKLDDRIAPGGTYTYTWEVPERAGPGPADPSSIVWLYHSHVDEPADTNAGLVGPILVTRADQANDDMTPEDVDREFVTLFTVQDENVSIYEQQNRKLFAAEADPEDEDYQESNLMHAMNGFVYSNLPGITMKLGDRVRWYLVALGTEVDLHTPHWHGNTVLSYGSHTDVVNLMPATMRTVTMIADNPGKWMYHCHVNDHIEAGMMGYYTVKE